MNKKKILYSTLLVLLIGIILCIFNAFNGNPLSKYLGKRLVKSYLEETYPDEEFRVENGQFNSKFNEYSYPVIKIGDDPYAPIGTDSTEEETEKQLQSMNYSIDVTGFLTQTVRYDSIRYSRIDTTLCKKLSKEASIEISNILKDQLPNIVTINVSMEVLKEQLPSDTAWSKDLELDRPIYIDIITDANEQDAKDAMEDGKTVQRLLNENGFDSFNVNINANGFDKNLGDKDEYGYVKYALSFDNEKNITLKDVEEFNKNLK